MKTETPKDNVDASLWEIFDPIPLIVASPPIPHSNHSSPVKEPSPCTSNLHILCQWMKQVQNMPSKTPSRVPISQAAQPPLPPKADICNVVAETLSVAFDAHAAGHIYYDSHFYSLLPEEDVFIVSWVDYCCKYGMGYALMDGTIGVRFNDSTTLVLSPNKMYIKFWIDEMLCFLMILLVVSTTLLPTDKDQYTCESLIRSTRIQRNWRVRPTSSSSLRITSWNSCMGTMGIAL